MNTKRWYEENYDLAEVIEFIQSLSDKDKAIIGQHLIQILINEGNIDLDSEFSKTSGKNYSYSRWYDKNFDISSALELLKTLPDIKQQFIVKRIITEIIMSYAKKEL